MVAPPEIEPVAIPERLSALALRFSGMDGIGVSFEFFPPRTEAMEKTLWRSILRLAPLEPRFVSVTYGAGGGARHRTHATVRRILEETSLTPAAHLTCVGASRAEVDEAARAYHAAGVRHIVALRGDPPEPGARYAPHPGGYAHAVDLVAGLRRIADFDVSVAAYPETHPEAPSPRFDLDNLKRKLDAGASRAITQFFFDTERFLGFRDRVRRAGIEAPLIPGILPVTNYGQVARFARLWRGLHAALAVAAVRDAGGRPGRAQAGRGDGRRGAVPDPRRRRRLRLPLLHPQPRRPHLRHLPHAGPARRGARPGRRGARSRIGAPLGVVAAARTLPAGISRLSLTGESRPPGQEPRRRGRTGGQGRGRPDQCQARGVPRTLIRHSRRVLRSSLAGSIGVPECRVWVVS